MRLMVALLLVVLSGLGNSAAGQQLNGSVGPVDRADRSAYRTLFRQVLLYKKLADEADKSPTPKPYLRHILADRLGLSDDNNTSLDRLAVAYQGEIDPIHKQVLATIASFHARFPLGVVPHGADTSPPPELATLQQQEDAVTLRYRDLLRNSMSEDDFQKFHTKVLASFGNTSGH
jgi:hypothetical protein